MPLYRLKFGFYDGRVLHKRGAVLNFPKDGPKPPKGSVPVKAEELEPAKLLAPEDAEAQNELYHKELREQMKKELLPTLKEELMDEFRKQAEEELARANATAALQHKVEPEKEEKPPEPVQVAEVAQPAKGKQKAEPQKATAA